MKAAVWNTKISINANCLGATTCYLVMKTCYSKIDSQESIQNFNNLI